MNRSRFITYFIQVCLGYPKIILSIIGIMSLIAIFQLNKIEVNNSIVNWFHPSDKRLMEYLDFRNDFGSDAYVTVFYRNENLFTKEGIQIHKNLSEELGSLSNVEFVVSLTNIKMPRLISNNFVLVPLLNPDAEDFDAIRNELTSQQIFIDNVISRDGNATGITLLLKDSESSRET